MTNRDDPTLDSATRKPRLVRAGLRAIVVTAVGLTVAFAVGGSPASDPPDRDTPSVSTQADSDTAGEAAADAIDR